MSDTSGTIRSFLDECADLDALVAEIPDAAWSTLTPAAGWTIAHQIAHLAWTDEVALLAVTDQPAFTKQLTEAAASPLDFVDQQAARGAALPPAELLERWRTGRAALAQALGAADPASGIPWFGPPMSPRSMATARLMETWAHGQDVADALGVPREPTERLKDICHLGIRTRDFGYRINSLEPPMQEFRVELSGPAGHQWEWGPADAASRVSGPAQDFCLVVTQRREVDDTALVATGEAANWLTFAQVFAGPPKAAVQGREG